ncbi:MULTISPECIES: ABC transporter permease [unclassified Streptomyces]|uniref:ABC transporter permease n=1 Tax=unclassified Streptomyces TaxID=2593676 RepID=UPI0006BB1F41|nr:ABC-2 type transporter [Actinobacteria bacterium OV450]
MWFRYTFAQFRLSQRVYWKQFGFALTAVIVPLGLGIAYPMSMHGKKLIAGIDAGQYALVGFIGFVLLWIVYNLINSAASRRDALIYKRLRGTALPDTSIFAGEALSGSVVSLAEVVVLIAAGCALMGSSGPENVPLFLIAVVLGAAMFAMVAIGVSGLLPNAEVSTWIVTPFMMLMMLGSGVTMPLSALPEILRTPAEYLPLTPVVEILRTAYFGRDFATDSAGPAVPDHIGFLDAFQACSTQVGIMCAWTAIGLALAQKYFRWDPRHAG